MAEMTRYEKMVLAATAAFVLVTGSWFLAKQTASAPYTVVTEQSVQGQADSVPMEETGQGQRPQALMEGEVINVNTADIYDLQRLPGIGEKRAQAIIAYREEVGPFQATDELLQISGIGQGIFAGLVDYITVE